MSDARVVLITGGGGGMGRAIAARFLEAGAKVAVSDLDLKRVESIVRELGAHGIQGDVTKVADCERMVQETVAKFGRLDVLVAAAGIWTEGPSDQATEVEWDKVSDVNLKGVFFTNRYAIPELEKTKGIIVNVSSVSGPLVTYVKGGAYGAAKAAMMGYTRSLALELASRGITANCIAPGWIGTGSSSGIELRAGRATPAGRPGKPEEIGAVALFLASEGASYLTGQLIVVDGGNTLQKNKKTKK